MITESDIVDTQPDSWVETCIDFRDQGLTSVDWLTAVDSVTGLSVLVHLVHPGSGDEAIVRCVVAGDKPKVDTLSHHFPGADWHERETAEMFGIEFRGREKCAPLLIRGDSPTPPMLRSTPLPERVDTPWPGAEEASERRRRRLSPGVRTEWMVADE